jgi:hypothetical protein
VVPDRGRDTTSLARVVGLIVAATTLALAALLLFAVHQPEVATGLALIALGGFVVCLLAAGSAVPHERLRSAEESARLGIAFSVMGGVLVVAAVPIAVVGDIAGALVPVALGATIATFGLSMLSAARMLRRVPALIQHNEEPRAVALGGNAMPGRPRILAVGTDGRIVWAEGRQSGEVHVVRLTEVEEFNTDPRAGELTVVGGGEVLRVKPVSKRELKKFERLLGSGEATRG